MDVNTTLPDAIQIIREARYAIVAVYSIQIYEWFATLGKEIELIYKSRWNSVKVAYLLCRYYPLLLWPIVIVAYCGTWSYDFCSRFGPPVHVLFMPCQLFPQAVMLMRAYAFSGRDKRVLALLLLCYAGLVAVDIWSFCTHVSTIPEIAFIALGGTGCYPYYGKGYMGFRIGYSMLAATLMDLISLTIVLGVCFRKKNREVSLARYFCKQGLVAFGLVIAVNVTAAGFFFNQRSHHNGLGLPFIMVVSNLIACRVILELRRKVSPSEAEVSAQYSIIIRRALSAQSDEWLIASNRDRWR